MAKKIIKEQDLEDLWDMICDQMDGPFLQDHFFMEIAKEFFEKRGYKIKEKKGE
ncbi:hypothetical protein ES705_38319 [subsurface metagenome]